jgi:hypothetical protein
MIDDADRIRAGHPSWDLIAAVDNQMVSVQTPSNYGCIFILQ